MGVLEDIKLSMSASCQLLQNKTCLIKATVNNKKPGNALLERLSILNRLVARHFDHTQGVRVKSGFNSNQIHVLRGRTYVATYDSSNAKGVSVVELKDKQGLSCWSRFWRALFDLFIQPLIDRSSISRCERIERTWNNVINRLYIDELDDDIKAYVKLYGNDMNYINTYFAGEGSTLCEHQRVLLTCVVAWYWKLTEESRSNSGTTQTDAMLVTERLVTLLPTDLNTIIY